MSLGSPKTSDEAWAPPEQFHEYRIVRALGRGRTGRVYLAHDTLLDRSVAVKFVPAGSADAMQRLLNEARAAARVQHPNVVTLYRVGQLDDYAYIVTEFTRGTSLDRLPKPQPAARVHGFALDLARGLAAAHRAGVLHRDLKPGNSVLTDDGVVKLLDFGLAKLLEPTRDRRTPAPMTRPPEVTPRPDSAAVLSLAARSSRGDLVGTPYYMAPEAWRGEEPTARSDLYSLGALLYELCAGRAPFRHVGLQQLPDAVEHQRPPPLAELAPGIDPGFAAAIAKCLEPDPLDRFATADALLDALEASAPRTPGDLPEGNPYRGLRPFEPEHRAFFFGRTRDLRELRDRLRGDAFVVLAGDSGVGKSSLAGAGLLPELETGVLGGERVWRAARLVPGHHPLAALADALAPLLGLDAVALEGALRAEPESLARRMRARLGNGTGVLVVVDQLEELVTLSKPHDADRMAIALATLAEGLPGVRLVATARSDFLTRLAGLQRLGAPLARAIYLVRPLDRADLREVVTGPARVKGVRFETEEMVEQLVSSTADAGGALPLLQFALAELWDRRDADRAVIPAAALQALGGVAGALARHADAVIDSLLPDQRRAARSLLLRLVTEDGTRARRTDQELAGSDGRHRAALEALVRGRLVVARDSDAGSTYELSHEALLVGWTTLARWLAEDAETRSVRHRLDAAALEWERLGQRPEALWGPKSVSEATALDEDLLAERERLFLAESRRGLLRRRRLRVVVAAGTLGLIALAAGGASLRATLHRNREIAEELGAATASHLRAEAGEQRETAARTEAFADFDDARIDDGESAWSRAIAAAAEADLALGEVGEHLERAAALGGERRDVTDALCAHLLERAIRADDAGRAELRDLFAQRLAGLDADGRYLRAFRAPASITVRADATAALHAFRFTPSPEGRLVPEPLSQVIEPGRPLEVPAGSYLIVREGSPPVRLPVLAHRGELLSLEVPAAPKLPPGFAFVPAGRFLFGSADEDSVRRFLSTTPIRPLDQPAFLIAEHETTWAEYLAYLDTLPDAERARRLPSILSSNAGAFRVTRPDGKWTLELQPGSVALHAAAGEMLHFPGRVVHADVDWLQMPVSGVSFSDAEAYAAWLSSHGNVPGARLCTEREWERAARGADARDYPHGMRIDPGDANFDVTYRRDPRAMGPDAVGSHPASASVFGVFDLSGNVWEWARSVLNPGTPVLRGGSYFHDSGTCRVTNRDTPDPSYRNMTVGMRMCADSPR